MQFEGSQPITLIISAAETQAIINKLAELPYQQVVGTMNKIITQFEAQLRLANAPVPVPDPVEDIPVVEAE